MSASEYHFSGLFVKLKYFIFLLFLINSVNFKSSKLPTRIKSTLCAVYILLKALISSIIPLSLFILPKYKKIKVLLSIK